MPLASFRNIIYGCRLYIYIYRHASVPKRPSTMYIYLCTIFFVMAVDPFLYALLVFQGFLSALVCRFFLPRAVILPMPLADSDVWRWALVQVCDCGEPKDGW